MYYMYMYEYMEYHRSQLKAALLAAEWAILKFGENQISGIHCSLGATWWKWAQGSAHDILKAQKYSYSW